jgi:hypothetical protein
MKEVKQALYPNRTPSPPGSEDRESGPPTPFEQRYARYESFDPSHPFAHFAGTSHMGFHSQLGGDFGQQAPSSTAPPPPPLEHQGLAWQMRSRPPSSVIQILVWQVALTHLFKILPCHHSLTHPSTPGQCNTLIFIRI